MRLVGYEEDEPNNKLNALINNVHRIWQETADLEYRQPNGKPFDRRGAAQMIFSDLGTLAVEDKRGFSAYRWIKDRLVALRRPRRRDRLHAAPQDQPRQAEAGSMP